MVRYSLCLNTDNSGSLKARGVGEIYIVYTSDRLGRELFALDESAISAPCEAMTIASTVTEAITISEERIQEAHVASYPNQRLTNPCFIAYNTSPTRLFTFSFSKSELR